MYHVSRLVWRLPQSMRLTLTADSSMEQSLITGHCDRHMVECSGKGVRVAVRAEKTGSTNHRRPRNCQGRVDVRGSLRMGLDSRPWSFYERHWRKSILTSRIVFVLAKSISPQECCKRGMQFQSGWPVACLVLRVMLVIHNHGDVVMDTRPLSRNLCAAPGQAPVHGAKS